MLCRMSAMSLTRILVIVLWVGAAASGGTLQEIAPTALQAEVLQLTAGVLDEAAIRRLIEIDGQLAASDSAGNVGPQQQLLIALAKSQNEIALEHVRSIFENAPERRGSVARALAAYTSARPTDLQDWRYMVRALSVVQGDEAVDVMKALLRFRTRANKAQWVRHVILAGLQLPPDQQSVAIGLLQHWTGVPRAKSQMSEWSLEKYQEWFAKEYPNEPEATPPTDQPNRKWTWASLESPVHSFKSSEALVQQGATVFTKATCQKCHRRGKVGEALGPDLTSLGWRRQRREILLAILYPSHELNEEYPTVTVVLKSGKSLTGMLTKGAAETLAIVSNKGVREEFPRTDVEQIVNQKTSNMPDGLLEPLTEEEILSLMAYLVSVEGIPRPHTDEGP